MPSSEKKLAKREQVAVVEIDKSVVFTSMNALRNSSVYIRKKIKSTAPIVRIKLTGISLKTFEHIECYLRTESFELTVENVLDIYSASAALHMAKLSSQCKKFVLKTCNPGDQALIYYLECVRTKQDTSTVCTFLANCLILLSQCRGFLRLSYANVSKLMYSPEISEAPFVERFAAMVRWLQFDCYNRKQYAKTFLSEFELHHEDVVGIGICPQIAECIDVIDKPNLKNRSKRSDPMSFPSTLAKDIQAAGDDFALKKASQKDGNSFPSIFADNVHDNKLNMASPIGEDGIRKNPLSPSQKSLTSPSSEKEVQSPRKRSKSRGPKSKGPKSKGPKTKTPRSKGPGTKGPKTKGPKTKGPKSKGPKSKGPKSKGPKTKGPKTKGPKSKGPKSKGPKSMRPQYVNGSP